ncbi:hypothetical protein ACA910_019230 [Epithemia clementina (nom. ined.)]
MEFVLPTVYGSTKCVRVLSPEKRALCFDIPAMISKSWNADMYQMIVSSITTPVKVADVLGQYLRRYLYKITCEADVNSQKPGASIGQINQDKCRQVDMNYHLNTQQNEKGKTSSSWAQQTGTRMSAFSLNHYKFDSTAAEKAVKDDSAKVHVRLWNFRIVF